MILRKERRSLSNSMSPFSSFRVLLSEGGFQDMLSKERCWSIVATKATKAFSDGHIDDQVEMAGAPAKMLAWPVSGGGQTKRKEDGGKSKMRWRRQRRCT